MILGSHNSWSYKTPTKWKFLAFTAKCQDLNIKEQYEFGVRCFDLRVYFKNGVPRIAHGMFDYGRFPYDDLEYLNDKGDVYIRILHEARNKKTYTLESTNNFITLCGEIQSHYPNLKFWCGRNLYNWNIDYHFSFNPSCEEKYSSVCSPKLIDDWWPRLYAKKNNKKILKEGTDKDILLIDFINYGH